MVLSNELLSQFAKATKDTSMKKQETIVYGTVVESNGVKYVRLDGSDILTPMASTTVVENNERVPVMIKNHMAVVTGNLTNPAIRKVDLDVAYHEIDTELTVQAGLINSKVSQDDFNDLSEKVQSNSSEITQTSQSITSSVTSVNQRIDTVIKSTNAALAGKVNDSELTAAVNEINSALEQKVDSKYLVENYSTIEQTSEKIKMEVGSKTVGGVNLIRIVDDTISVTNGAVSREWGKDVWCQSSTGIILHAYNSDFNGVVFNTDVQVSPGDYMLSFWCWTYGMDIQPTVRCNLFSGADDIDHYFRDISPTPNAPVRYEIPITVTYNATVNLRLLTWSKWTSGELYFCDVKLETGKTATAWSPHAEEFRAGSSVSITEKQVKIISPETMVGIPSEDGERMVAQFDENGLTADFITAGNMTYRYTGAATLHVKSTAGSDELSTGSYYRSLTDACSSLSDRTVTKDITINVLDDTYGDVVLANICGGSITIQGNGHSLIGTLNMKDCTSRINVYDLTVSEPVSNEAISAMWIANCRYVAMEGSVKIIGKGGDNGGNNALVIEGGSTVWMFGTELYNATDLIYATYGTHVTASGLKGGGCTNFAWANGCILKMAGSRPVGGFSMANAALLVPSDPTTLPIDSGSTQSGSSTVQTVSWKYVGSDSYAGGWSAFADDDIRQGFNGHRIYGVIWFNAEDIRSTLSGKNVKQASLSLHMHKGIGRGVNVNIQLYGTNMSYTGHSGEPKIGSYNYGTIGMAVPGEVNEITIPNDAINDFLRNDDPIQALVLFSDDVDIYKNRGHSTNYARFSGSTSADDSNCPRLTVTYE